MVTKFNVSKPEKYIKDGVEKTYWANVGTMTEFTKDDGSVSRILEIPAIGLKANIFPVEPRPTPTSDQKPQGQAPVPLNGVEYPEEENNEDIPF